MNMTVGCPIPGASQPKESVRPVDANGILRSVDMSGCAYDGSEYQAYKAGVEYVRGLIDDAPTIDPETLRPTAYWRGDYDGYADGNPVYDVWHCDACDYCIDDGTDDPELLPKYCPNCGARMVNVYEQDNKNH